MKKMSIGLLGLGTVGTGVVHLIRQQEHALVRQTGVQWVIDKILVKDINKSRNSDVGTAQLTMDVQDIVDDPHIDIVIEVMGGITTAKEAIERALCNGKSVVTANKDVMALHGATLCALAQQYGCDLYYEASVAGGIPIIRTLTESFSADRLHRICGIVNGTTNYMLTKMTQEGCTYEEVLQEAQALGYAEADPSADVFGWDAARKMAILSTLAFRMEVELADVTTEGIAQVTPADIAYGKKLGYTLKLLGIAQSDGDRVAVSVQPTMVQQNHPLASVHGVFNAVYVHGDAVGEAMFVGPGAGSLATATSVVADVVTAVRNVQLGISGRSWFRAHPPRQLMCDEDVWGHYFFLLHVDDRIGVLAQITELFATQGVSIESVLQQAQPSSAEAEIILITHETNRAAYMRVTEALHTLPVVRAVKSVYRVIR